MEISVEKSARITHYTERSECNASGKRSKPSYADAHVNGLEFRDADQDITGDIHHDELT